MVIRALERWYQENGLDPWNFQCSFLSDCKRDQEDFTIARPPMIGQFYEEGSLPRLVVLSSDPGSGDPLSDIRGFTLSGPDPGPFRKKSHWSETLELVYAIQVRFDSSLDMSDASASFLHERAVKCCENNRDSREASDRLFLNCRDYVAAEIPILLPDIIVTQGNRATNAVERAGLHGDQKWSMCDCDGHGCKFRVLTLPSGKLVLWLFTYHPTSRYQYYPTQRDGYFACYPVLAEEFVKGPEKFWGRK